MKTFLALTLLLAAFAFANEATTEKAKAEEKSESKKESKLAGKKAQHAEAYKKAKEACLSENKELKGKELKECIVKKQSEAK
jgi:hypothetical protein